MPLWVVIMVLGAAGCGWLFLKARQMEASQTKKKVKEGSKDVRKAAKEVAKRPSGIEPYQVPTSEEKVSMSKDLAGQVAKDIAEILEREK